MPSTAFVAILFAWWGFPQDEPPPPPSPEEARKELEKKVEKEAQEKLAAFRKAVSRAKVEDQISEAIKELGSLQHPKILKEWKKQISSLQSLVHRRMVVQEIAKYKEDPEALKILLEVLSSEAGKATQDAQARDIDHEIVLDLMAVLGQRPPSKEVVSKLTSLFYNRNLSVARGAVDTLRQIRALESVDSLLGLLKQLESTNAQPPQTQGSGSSTPSQFVRYPGQPDPAKPNMTPQEAQQYAAYQRKTQLTYSILSAFDVLLGTRKATAAEYADHWTKNKDKLWEEENKRRQPPDGGQ